MVEFHGDVARYRDWRRHILIYHATVPDDRRHLTVARVLGALRGEAYEACRHYDPEQLRQQGDAGLRALLAFLDERYGWQPESLLHEAMEAFLYFAPRRGGETITAFLARYHSALERFVATVNEHMQTAARKRHADEQRTFLQTKVEWLSAHAAYQQFLDLEGEEAQADHGLAEDPGAMPAPPVLVLPPRFELPPVISGFLLLRKLGLDRKGRSDLIRAAKVLDLPALERVLRSSEAEHFTSRSGALHAEFGEPGWEEEGDGWEGGGWAATASADEEDIDFGGDSGGEAEDDDDDAVMAAIVEEHSRDEAVGDAFSYMAGQDDDAAYQQEVAGCEEAWVAWQAARKRLDQQRKARGFVPVRKVVRAMRRGKGKGRRKGGRKGGGKKGKGSNSSSPGLPSSSSLPPGAPVSTSAGPRGRGYKKYSPKPPTRPSYQATASTEQQGYLAEASATAAGHATDGQHAVEAGMASAWAAWTEWCPASGR